MDQIMKLMQNPTVMQVVSNPKVMNAVMSAMSMRGKVAGVTSAATKTVARSLGLATRDEVRELRRTVRRLEEQLNDQEAEGADRVPGRDG